MIENDLPTLQWFPGHMKKAQRLIESNLKLVDIVIEVLDARIPSSSQNPLLKKILGSKPRLIALCKSDLADPKLTDAWIEHFRAENISAVAVDAVKGAGIKNLIAVAKKIAEPFTHKMVRRQCPIRARDDDRHSQRREVFADQSAERRIAYKNRKSSGRDARQTMDQIGRRT